MRLFSFSLILLTSALLLVSPPASAFTMNYGDCDGGGTVAYEQVTESNSGASALYNAPSCVGNLINFDPTGFVADSQGAGAASIDGQLNFSVLADPGSSVEEITLSELGDYTLLGIQASTFASATMTVTLEIVELNQGGAVFIQDPNNQTNVTFTLPVDFDPAGTWSLEATFDINQILADAGEEPGAKAKRVNVVVDNTLSVFALSGEVARITKKDLNGLSVTAVPEPGAGLLLGLAGLAWVGRRRS